MLFALFDLRQHGWDDLNDVNVVAQSVNRAQEFKVEHEARHDQLLARRMFSEFNFKSVGEISLLNYCILSYSESKGN